MSSQITEKSKIVLEYLDKYPSMPSHTLARIICQENEGHIAGVEGIRGIIRKYRGKNGIEKRMKTQNKTHYNDKILYRLPKSDRTDYTPYGLADGKWLIMADIHLPYHDEAALRQTIAYAKKEKITGILLNGDLIDCYEISRFNRDPRMRRFKDELIMATEFIGYLKQEFKRAKIVLKMGNHEARYEDYMFRHAPALVGIDVFNMSCLLGKHAKDIDIVEEQLIIDAGNITILHGHEYRQTTYSPVNPARSMFLKAKACTLSAHEHQASMQPEPTIKGKMLVSYSIGCLCDLNPKYRPLNKWGHGFAIMDKHGGDFHVYNKRILQGGIYD